jgi:hypothetical protein
MEKFSTLKLNKIERSHDKRVIKTSDPRISLNRIRDPTISSREKIEHNLNNSDNNTCSETFNSNMHGSHQPP